MFGPKEKDWLLYNSMDKFCCQSGQKKKVWILWGNTNYWELFVLLFVDTYNYSTDTFDSAMREAQDSAVKMLFRMFSKKHCMCADFKHNNKLPKS